MHSSDFEQVHSDSIANSLLVVICAVNLLMWITWEIITNASKMQSISAANFNIFWLHDTEYIRVIFKYL